MTTLDFTEVELQDLITHHVGNKLRDESFSLSSETTIIENDTKNFLLKYFLLPIKLEEFYSFTHSVELQLNNVYSVVDCIFSDPKQFISSSQNIAKLLYEHSMHPRIKGGELNVAYFSNLLLNDSIVDAVGIFKSETNIPYIKMKRQKSKFNINHDYGFEIKGMDKGCIIFNVGKNDGYKILVIDNSQKSSEAQYWKDDFLKIRPIANEFYQTNQFLGITKEFVSKQLPLEIKITKANKINLLNRSVDYFKAHENFDKDEFEKEVLQDGEIIKSFRDFNLNYKNEIDIVDNFVISPQAVKKQSRIFKGIIKLDQNFQIHINGNSELIEQGIDANGRKFYKIYFENES